MKTEKWKERLQGVLFALIIMAAAAVGAVTGSSLNAPMALNELNVLLAGEDQTNNVLRVEQQFSRGLAAGADTSIKTGSGFVHTVSCWGSDVAATAGDIAIRDATSAGSGTVIEQFQIAAALLLPVTAQLNVPVTTGIYVDFTTTNDVTCTVSYR